MTTRIEAGGPITGVSPTLTAPRVTPPPAQPFRNVMRAGAQAVVSGAEQAVRSLPGGPILAAAMRPGPGSTGYAGSDAFTAEGPMGTAAVEAGNGSVAGSASVESVIDHNADLNTRYLLLQEQISAENREYTAMSNVLKARHDTVKNAIGNIR
jgi:hypothetical protein